MSTVTTSTHLSFLLLPNLLYSLSTSILANQLESVHSTVSCLSCHAPSMTPGCPWISELSSFFSPRLTSHFLFPLVNPHVTNLLQFPSKQTKRSWMLWEMACTLQLSKVCPSPPFPVPLHMICFTHFMTCLIPVEVTNFVNPFDRLWQREHIR